jgi:hypothetical protein
MNKLLMVTMLTVAVLLSVEQLEAANDTKQHNYRIDPNGKDSQTLVIQAPATIEKNGCDDINLISGTLKISQENKDASADTEEK